MGHLGSRYVYIYIYIYLFIDLYIFIDTNTFTSTKNKLFRTTATSGSPCYSKAASQIPRTGLVVHPCCCFFVVLGMRSTTRLMTTRITLPETHKSHLKVDG